MKRYLKTDEWNIIEEGFDAERLKMSESIFSIGNGRFGQRGNFEEPYSSEHYRGSFVGGIPFLDKTRVGWWKNGFPTYYTRIPRAANWSYIGVRLIDDELDLAQWAIDAFSRRLDMKEGIAYRDCSVTSLRGNSLRIQVEHLANQAHPDLCQIKYRVTSVNYRGKLSLVPALDISQDTSSPEGDKIWNVLGVGVYPDCAYLWTQTRREDAQVCYAQTYQFYKNGQEVNISPIRIERDLRPGFSLGVDVKPGDSVTLIKYVAICTSLYHERQALVEEAVATAREARQTGWESLKADHVGRWADIWEDTDVQIEGDPEAQQGIRYNIFQLYQTWRGDDNRLNIAPKGFTGEKYGGNTYWNTELCCVPFYLISSSQFVTQNLLMYRYNQLPKAIENARKLGFSGGAALYPQVTLTGEECHNEWEITFEEIHRNNIILFAIIQHSILTGTQEYIAQYGLEVMIAICRFWSQRVSFSQPKQQYVILGVTGPDEFENNVDNNWYTNYSCVQSLRLTLRYLEYVEQNYPADYQRICQVTHFDRDAEVSRWRDIIGRMYLPKDAERGIFVQHDGYLDKELKPASEIPASQRPINQHWSWDRILRSCYIKQSDVLLGLYLYNYQFDLDTIRRNFEFYEPMTVHESSLSPHIHAILAARIGQVEKAYQLFLHATRLDLDDYNNEAEEGLHVTSMPGSWLALVKGFAGFHWDKGRLVLHPVLPAKWKRYAFKLHLLGSTLQIEVDRQGCRVHLLKGEPVNLVVE